MKLSGDVFAVQHNSYSVSRFELNTPNESIEMAGNFSVTNNIMNMKKDNENSRPLNSVCVSCAYIVGINM